MRYQLSPLCRAHRVSEGGQLSLDAGKGDSRQSLVIGGDSGSQLIGWLFAVRGDQTEEDLLAHMGEELQMDAGEARELLASLVDAEVLVTPEQAEPLFNSIAAWDNYGWRDPADFHFGHQDESFVPDTDGGATYERLYSELQAANDEVCEQPEHYAAKATRQALGLKPGLSPERTLQDTFEHSRPANKFVGPEPDTAQLVGALVDAVGVQRVVGGRLGSHQLRSYPSGGARHPLEFYVVSKGVDGIPLGAYWFDPLTHELHPRDNEISAEAVDAACFGKGGVVSSRILVAITVRWTRHSWKYRYSRSYRMVLLELGHAIQSLNLSMRARGIDVYQCPSINDSEWLEMLALDDDAQEGPMYVLSFGTYGRI